MSDIITNANRYNTSNSTRIDGAGKNAGNSRSADGSQILFDCSGLVHHVLRESGYNVPYASSSAMVDDHTFKGGWATPVTDPKAVSPGMLVYFSGHVGLVQTYDPKTGMGTFLSMTGKNNSGEVKPAVVFTTDEDATGKMRGANNSFKGFAAVKPELYDPKLDQHANGANPDTPVFNIPQHKNGGFITLPDNGGFPASSAARDLSSNPAVAAAHLPTTNTPSTNNLYTASPTSAFAQTLAHLESQGQPNNGYGGFNPEGGGIGAIGRYGFRAPSLQAIGWMDADGNWANAAKAQGVSSVQSFLDHPQAQEAARVACMQPLKSELKANGAWSMIGETVEGDTVAEAGLIAAAWKEGAGGVVKVFNGQSTSANLDENVFFRMDEFGGVATGADADSTVFYKVAAAPTGHWEYSDDAYHDPQPGIQVGGSAPVWVADAPADKTPSSQGHAATPAVVAKDPAVTAFPPPPQISPDGSTATLPNGQIIRAGTGGTLDIDADGNLVVSRPAQGWTNADGSPSDIRQITTYDAKGAQLGTTIALSATDSAGNLQGLLVLNQNGNGLIETRDILNIGGNAEQVGNATDEASWDAQAELPTTVAYVNSSQKVILFREKRMQDDCDKPTNYFQWFIVDRRMAINARRFLAGAWPPLFLSRQLHTSFVMAMYLRISEKLKTHLILPLLALPVVLGMSTGLAWAKAPVLDPAQLGTFCPPGSELADAKHTQILSIKEQTQIKKTVEGFMALDAEYRRSGSPLGPSDYWEKGYTLEFDDGNEVPDDGLQYVAAKFTNTCTQADVAISTVLLDVAEFGPSELNPFFKNRFLSSQGYWDAFSKIPVKPPSKTEWKIPDQPLVFVALPLKKNTGDRWLVEQRKVPVLVKFRRSEWQRQIDQTNLFSCSHPKSSPQYSADRCAQMEKDKATLKQLSRPAWSVVPNDFNPALLPR